MTQAYYTLRWSRPGHWYEKEERLSASADTVRIGQQDSCDARVENDGMYADEVFALIRPSASEQWLLIPVSGFVSCYVNGTPVTLVHYLRDGDRIRFSETDYEFQFELRRDGTFSSTGVHRTSALSRTVRMSLLALPLILVGFLSYAFFKSEQESRAREKELAIARSSVVQISVDSVFYVCSTAGTAQIVRSFSYVQEEGISVNGTAFITRDSLLITARHCIEPWLNDKNVLWSNLSISAYSVPVRWALEAETYNQTHAHDTIYRVVSKCTLAGGEDASNRLEETFLSSDFFIDTSRDEVVEVGSFSQVHYWRSITGRFALRDMMLGDIAYVKVSRAGNIRLASAKLLSDLLVQGTSLIFMGYPEYQTSGFEQSEGRLRRNFTPGEMIVHSGELLHGYSGGPVLIASGNSVWAVGVISVLDNSGGSRIYSVPVSELKKETDDE